jgi:hypothetical protein
MHGPHCVLQNREGSGADFCGPFGRSRPGLTIALLDFRPQARDLVTPEPAAGSAAAPAAGRAAERDGE